MIERVQRLQAADRKLAPWIARIGLVDLPSLQKFSLLDALARSILFQQLNAKAAETILARLLTLSGQRQLTAAKLQALTVEQYRSVGVSNNKALALQSLAQFALQKQLPSAKQLLSMSNSDIIEALLPIRGIGAWTVQMLLIFRMGRHDVWPVDDFGVRKGVQIAHNMDELPSAKQLQEMAQKRWKPEYTLAALYFWRIADLEKSARVSDSNKVRTPKRKPTND